MAAKDIIDILRRLKNEDETKWLETRTAILEYFKEALPLDCRDTMYTEENRLEKEINDVSEKEKKE